MAILGTDYMQHLQPALEIIYARFTLKLDYIRQSSVAYDPATSAATSDEQIITVRAQEQTMERARFLTNLPDSMIEVFDRLVEIPAPDCVASGSPFTPSVNDRLEWPSASERGTSGEYQIYRVVQVFPQSPRSRGQIVSPFAGNNPVWHLLSLRNA